MSLKAFHFIFIFCSTLLALGLGVWCVWVNLVEGNSMYRWRCRSLPLPPLLRFVVYGVWFYRKMKRLGIIT